MSAVQNGVIQRISPSMISAFDGDSRFGCERRGWFKYVLGKKEPTTPEMTRGTHLHAMNEEYLKTGRILLGTPEQTAWFKAGRHFLEALKRPATEPHGYSLLIEMGMPLGFAVEGVPVSEMSKCDVVVAGAEPAIIDWKTTGSIEKNGKTPGQLAKDVQLLIYAKAFHPVAPQVKLTHGYYQVDHPVHFKPVSVELSRQELDDNYGQVIIPRVAKMKEVVRATDAKDVKPNRDACRRCPHSSYCPPDKENPIMGIFAALKKSVVAPTTPAAEDKIGQVTPETVIHSRVDGVKPELRDGKPFVPFTAILPPDAPKSDPALAAKPVEGFQAVPPPKERRMKYDDVPADPPPTAPATPSAIAKAPAPVPTPPPPPPAPAPEPEKRGRGRPPGAKNKAKSEPTSPETVYQVNVDARLIDKPSVTFESVTVNYGLTLNLGNFNSARIDCAMTAKFQGSPDVAFTAVLEKVQANVAAEINKLEEKFKLNPNKGEVK